MPSLLIFTTSTVTTSYNYNLSILSS